MLTWKQAVFGQGSVTKVAGLFASHSEVEGAVRELQHAASFDLSQLHVLGPEDGNVARKAVLDRDVEPDQRGIWFTLVGTHTTVLGGLLALRPDHRRVIGARLSCTAKRPMGCRRHRVVEASQRAGSAQLLTSLGRGALSPPLQTPRRCRRARPRTRFEARHRTDQAKKSAWR